MMKRLVFSLLMLLGLQLTAHCQQSAVHFIAMPVPDSIWVRMQGKTYQPNPYISRDDLRYLRVLHWDYDNRTHQGEMVCNKLIAQRLVDIFRRLYEARYPIQRMVLPDVYDADDERQMRDNNTSCFCYRTIAGSKTLSRMVRSMSSLLRQSPMWIAAARSVIRLPSAIWPIGFLRSMVSRGAVPGVRIRTTSISSSECPFCLALILLQLSVRV